MKDNTKVTITILFVILIIILSIIPLTVNAYEGNAGIFLITELNDYSIAGFNLSNIDFEPVVYQSQSLTDFYMPICIKKEDVQSIQDKDVEHTILNGNQNFSDRLRSIDFNIYESDNYWLVLYEMNVFASDKDFNIDFVPKIKGEELTHFAWFNSTFKYLSGSCITNNISDYSMMINVSNVTGGDLVIGTNHQINWSDIRFVSEDNSTELYHWIEYSQDNYAYFWINISDEDYINCYYGANISVGNSTYNNPYSTFYFFEPFNDLGNWTVVGSNIVCNDGILTLTNDGTYDYVYIDLDDTSNDYFMKTKINVTAYSGDNSYHGILMGEEIQGYFGLPENSMVIGVYDKDSSCALQCRQHDSVGEVCLNSYGLYNKLGMNIISYIGYDYHKIVYYENMGLIASDNAFCGADTPIDVITIFTRAIGISYVTNWHYLIVGLYNGSNEPSFCSWSAELPYCSTLFSLTNESPVDDSVVASLNISYITMEVNFTLVSGDSINISLVADNGLFYRNVSNPVNDSYSLNVIFANFSTESNYTYYVNFTGSGCFASFDYTFATTQYNLYDILQIIDYKIDFIDNKIIGVDDELDINIGLDGTLLTLVLFAVFFVVGYTINKRSGGILMIFSGFTLIAFEFLVSSVLNAFLVIPLLSPIAILIIILGVRKWLYPVENEKTKSEGT